VKPDFSRTDDRPIQEMHRFLFLEISVDIRGRRAPFGDAGEKIFYLRF